MACGVRGGGSCWGNWPLALVECALYAMNIVACSGLENLRRLKDQVLNAAVCLRGLMVTVDLRDAPFLARPA